MQEDHEHEGAVGSIKLDGTYGLKDRALLTLITKDDSGIGDRREKFVVPYVLIDFKSLNAAAQINLIRGYEIVRQERNPEEV